MRQMEISSSLRWKIFCWFMNYILTCCNDIIKISSFFIANRVVDWYISSSHIWKWYHTQHILALYQMIMKFVKMGSILPSCFCLSFFYGLLFMVSLVQLFDIVLFEKVAVSKSVVWKWVFLKTWTFGKSY